jgi:hypothetical protein
MAQLLNRTIKTARTHGLSADSPGKRHFWVFRYRLPNSSATSHASGLHPQLFEQKRIHVRLALGGGPEAFADAVARAEVDEQQDWQR